MNTRTHPGAAPTRATAPVDARSRSVWPGGVAVALSILACYGTLAAVALLPIFGIALAPDDTLWGAAIVAPAVLSLVVLAWGARHHGSWLPACLALAGVALLSVLMFWQMNRVLEALAFALLLAAVVVERRHCARCAVTVRREHGHA